MVAASRDVSVKAGGTGNHLDNQPDNHAGSFAVYWPRARRAVKRTALAPRLDTLAGKKIALLWDYIFRGDDIFEVLQSEIAKRYPGVSFIHWSEFGNIHGNDEREIVAALPDRLRALGADAVICGMAC